MQIQKKKGDVVELSNNFYAEGASINKTYFTGSKGLFFCTNT